MRARDTERTLPKMAYDVQDEHNEPRPKGPHAGSYRKMMEAEVESHHALLRSIGSDLPTAAEASIRDGGWKSVS